jgi:hypothetical protein
MVTYLYWGCVIGLVILLLFLIGGKMDNWRAALFATMVTLLAGWAAYYFHLQQIFVKRYGGVMSLSVPDGQYHIAATWKGDHLWIENYDPEKNICHFQEYSKGNMLQGKVSIKNCHPLAYAPENRAPAAIAPPDIPTRQSSPAL